MFADVFQPRSGTSSRARTLPRIAFDVANSTPGRTLAATLVAWLLLFGLCKQLLWRDPHSGFFSEEGVYDLGYSTVRQREAHTYIEEAEVNDAASAPTGPQKPPPVVCAALTTFKRDPTNYLNETVGSMLIGLTSEERSALDVRVLFTHVNPTIHVDWNKSWLRILDHWSGYNVSAQELDQIREWEDAPNYYAKGV